MPSESQQYPRTVTAPPPSSALANAPANRVFSVILEADEDVEWMWTHTTDGISYVSGYGSVKNRER
jgi:hypothetical protein